TAPRRLRAAGNGAALSFNAPNNFTGTRGVTFTAFDCERAALVGGSLETGSVGLRRVTPHHRKRRENLLCIDCRFRSTAVLALSAWSPECLPRTQRSGRGSLSLGA